MKRSLSLGEVNNRILLTVTAINVLIDYELTLKGLDEDLCALRKRKDSYVQALKDYEERAFALREKYKRLSNEVKQASLTKPQIHLRLTLAQRQLDAQPNVLLSLISGCRMSPLASPPPPSPPPELPVTGLTSPTAGFSQKGYLHELKQRWRRKQHHLRPDTHATLRRAECHLARVSSILVLKREESLRVQRRICAAKENINIETEAIKALQAKLSSPLWYLYSDEYNEYCKLLHARLLAIDAKKRHRVNKVFKQRTISYGSRTASVGSGCRALSLPTDSIRVNTSTC